MPLQLCNITKHSASFVKEWGLAMCEVNRKVNRKVVANAATKAKYMKSYYDRNVRGPYPNKGDRCMLVVDVRKHKFKGPYQIVEKINNWNYIVNIDGTRKIVSISKLKIYKPNKYSNLAVNGQPKAGHWVNLPTVNLPMVKNGGKRELHESSSSTDSDDEWSAIVTRSRAKKSAAKLNGKTKTSNVDGKRRSDAGSRVNRGGNSGFLAGQDSISERQVRDMGSGGTRGHGSKLDLQDQIPNLDKSATEDVTDVFPAFNDQSLNIADIGRYETEQKVRDVPNYQNFKNLPNFDNNTPKRGDGSKYNLRPKPTKLFGSDVSRGFINTQIYRVWIIRRLDKISGL